MMRAGGGLWRSVMTIRRVGAHVEMDEEEARSGQTGVHVRYVLITSTLMVVAGFLLVALASAVW